MKEMTAAQLELMTRVVCPDYGSDYVGVREGLFFCAKQKLREVILRRFSGSDNPFSWGLYDAELRQFSSPHEIDPGWENFVIWSACDDLDAAGADLLKSASIMETLSILMYFTGIEEGDLHMTISPQDPVMPKDKKRTSVETALEDFAREVWMVDDEEDLGMYAGFLIALDKAADGFIEEAMDDLLFAELIDGLQDSTGNVFSNKFLVEHMSEFLFPYMYGCPDNKASLAIFTSREVYLYDKYKDRLPEKVRKTVDKAIEMFCNPLKDIGADTGVYTDEEKQLKVILATAEETSDLQSVHPFWKDVKEYLVGTLPTLRKEYMS